MLIIGYQIPGGSWSFGSRSNAFRLPAYPFVNRKGNTFTFELLFLCIKSNIKIRLMHIGILNLVKRCSDSTRFHYLCKRVQTRPILCKRKFVQGRCRKACGICTDSQPKDTSTQLPKSTTSNYNTYKRDIGKNILMSGYFITRQKQR